MAETRRILVIAGSDSSGGAGLEADQKVIALHGCYAMTATTALTAQNTRGVFDIHYPPPAFVVQQINACLEDVGVDVVKIGMLASTETVEAVARVLRSVAAPIVLDPVMVASTGAQLLSPEAISTLVSRLLGLATILTPNIPEAKLLLGENGPDPRSREDMIELARRLQQLGPKYVLLKGGHLRSDTDSKICDVLYGAEAATVLEKDIIRTKNTHGTGCSLASAIACQIARGKTVPDAVRAACEYVDAGIRSALPLGQGHGPINHFHSSFTLPFAPDHFLDYLLARADVSAAWKQYTDHDFLRLLQNGTLPMARFQAYIKQDFLFLTQFARAKAVAAAKRSRIEEVAAGATEVLNIRKEMELHLTFCRRFGVSLPEIEQTKASQACIAYTRYVLDVAQTDDWMALQVVTAPCLVGYGQIADRLFHDEGTVRGEANPYWPWIENYVAHDYVDAVKLGREEIEKQAVLQSPSRVEELVRLFINATELETGFWAMAGSHEDSTL